MRTNLLLILPLVLSATVGTAQEMVGTLQEDIRVTSAIDGNGQLYYSEGSYVFFSHPEQGRVEELFRLPSLGRADNLMEVNGAIYFTSHNQDDEAALWKSTVTFDGGMATTQTVSLIQFDETYQHISPLVHVGDMVYFGFEDKLYQSDGTPAGTSLVIDLNATGDQGFLLLSAFDNLVFISFRKSSGEYELWKSNGTASGTALVTSFRQIEFLAEAGEKLYFVGDDGSTGRELWNIGSTGPPMRLSDISPGGASSFDFDATVFATGSDAIVFSTVSPAATWISQGSSPTQLASVSASETVYSDGIFYFIHNDDLWKSDGTTGGTSVFKTFSENDSLHPRLRELTAVGETVFFSVDGLQLWETDGSATVRIFDHTPDTPEPAGTMDLLAVGDQLFFFGGVTSGQEWFDFPNVYRYKPSDVWIPSLQLVDAVTNQDIGFLENNATIYIGQNISIRADASLATGSVRFVIPEVHNRREQERPFAIAGDNSGNYNAWNVPPGVYQLTVTPFSHAGAQGSAVTYTIKVVDPVEGCGTGTISREVWTNIKGNQLSGFSFDFRPSIQESLNMFEGPTNSGSNYVSRIKGYVCPPETGNYTFWISSNDHSELWLSTNDDPRNKVLIAAVTGATNPREWDKFSSQKSVPIPLEVGKRYYVEARHKQGVGTANLAVGWQLPNGELERPIGGNRLSPFTGNQPPEVEIVSPIDGQVFTAPATILLQAETHDSDGFAEKIEFFAGSLKLDEYNHQFEWKNVQPGSYEIYARVRDNDGAVTISPSVTVTVTGSCTASGGITREYWNGVPGSQVSDIPVNSSPSGEMELTSFEAPENIGTHYGARIRGFLCPPASGDYIFWIASNDNSELWLSTDDDPSNKVRIASVTGATNPRQWNKFTSQRSAPVPLISGKRYYLEALHKQGVGSDHLAVGWQLPDGTMQRPMAGDYLSPFTEKDGSPSAMIYPADGATDIDPLVMKLETAPVIGAKRYTVEISPNAGFNGPITTIQSVDDYQTTFVVKDLAHATTYHIRVKTDISGFGPVKEFTTRHPIGLHRLWGLTTEGGKDNLGTIFSFSIDSSHFVKHYDKELLRYEWGDGEDEYVEYEERFLATPVAGPDGTLYGQSDHEYNSNMFVMNETGEVTWLSPHVSIYRGNIMLASNNNIFVTTEPYLIGGGIGRYSLDEPHLTSNLRFFNQKEHGLDPSVTLLEVGEFLYGTTEEGGINDGGVVYRIRHDGTDFQIIHYFDDVYGGRTPMSGLTEADGFLYGTTAYGGAAQDMGTIFRIRLDGSEFAKLHDFDGADGRHPVGEVIIVDDVVYGMTSRGGISDRGTVYRVGIDGSGFVKLHDFDGMDGDLPSGALTHDSEGNLYGMTSRGGVTDMGVIFTIQTNGSGFVKLYDFNPTSGGRPDGSLVIREDTFAPPMGLATSFAEADVMNLSIHPNPSTDNFMVHVKTPGDDRIQLVVTDQYGQLVTSYELMNDIPMQVGSELKRGLYIMKVIQGKEITMRRVVKK